jgi:predicted RNase H-like HicB family nuclease
MSELQQYPHYPMVIEWSEEDGVYLATIPELGPHHTHGKTYAEAARQGQDLLETLVDDYISDGQPLPEPQVFSYQKWHGHDNLLS